jgi:nicotinamidase-related amidase
MTEYPRSHELLSRDESRLLIIDVQEKLVPVIAQRTELVANCGRLIAAANLFQVPIFATEQYPKGLGPTIPQLADQLPPRIEKLEFSCLNCLNWGMSTDDSTGRFKVVVAGVETHVCVQQTVFDLLSYGYRVYVVADAVGSRRPLDKQFALQRLASFGAIVTTTESVLFEWCERAGTPEFKEISRLVK